MKQKSVLHKVGVILLAVVQNTLIGRSRNKVGSTVFSTWKGINVLKSKPLTVAQPPSIKRDAQQSVIRQLNAIGRPILGAIRVSFNQVSAKSTNWASWIKYNADTAFNIVPPTATLLPDSMIFAKGTLIKPSDLALTSITVRDVLINWTDNSSDSGNSVSDKVAIALITAAAECYVFTNVAARSDESATVTIPGLTATGLFSIYVWFYNEGNKKAQDSFLVS